MEMKNNGVAESRKGRKYRCCVKGNERESCKSKKGGRQIQGRREVGRRVKEERNAKVMKDGKMKNGGERREMGVQ